MFLKQLKENWKSGITVALVSIPLSVSLAVASQATPIDGIITAIWAGLVAAIFGGSHFNIVGPTGALSGILATYAIAHGADALSVLAIATGIIILIAYALKLERYLVFVPASSLHGFTLGVALIIAFNQFNFATGLTGLEKHEKFIDNVIESVMHVGQSSLTTVAVFGLFLVALFALVKYAPKIPAVIAVTPIGILLGYATTKGWVPLALQTLESRFSDLNPVLFQMPQFTIDKGLLTAASAVALVAILETMLSAKIADMMTHTKHDKRKEMLGLGLANIATGAAGGIPATAALARTSLNIKSGANNRMSGVVSGVAIALISLLLLSTFKFVPLAVIAAILVFTAARMVELHHFTRLYALDRKEFGLAMVVAFVTVYEDPIIGIMFGTAAALLLFVDKLSHGQFEIAINDKDKKLVKRVYSDEETHTSKGAETLVYSIKGQLAYLNSAAHLERLEGVISNYKNVVLRMRELYLIDVDGVEAFDEIAQLLESKHKQVYVSGVSPLIAKQLHDSKLFQRLSQEGRVFAKTRDALTQLGFEIK